MDRRRGRTQAEKRDVERVEQAGRHVTRHAVSKARRQTVADWIQQISQDLAYAQRGLRRSPGFTLVVLAGAALLLALMAFAAILTPALRAARSDPASALRSE